MVSPHCNEFIIIFQICEKLMMISSFYLFIIDYEKEIPVGILATASFQQSYEAGKKFCLCDTIDCNPIAPELQSYIFRAQWERTTRFFNRADPDWPKLNVEVTSVSTGYMDLTHIQGQRQSRSAAHRDLTTDHAVVDHRLPHHAHRNHQKAVGFQQGVYYHRKDTFTEYVAGSSQPVNVTYLFIQFALFETATNQTFHYQLNITESDLDKTLTMIRKQCQDVYLEYYKQIEAVVIQQQQEGLCASHSCFYPHSTYLTSRRVKRQHDILCIPISFQPTGAPEVFKFYHVLMTLPVMLEDRAFVRKDRSKEIFFYSNSTMHKIPSVKVYERLMQESGKQEVKVISDREMRMFAMGPPMT